jgi:hypothetical protein
MLRHHPAAVGCVARRVHGRLHARQRGTRVAAHVPACANHAARGCVCSAAAWLRPHRIGRVERRRAPRARCVANRSHNRAAAGVACLAVAVRACARLVACAEP